MLNQAPSTRNEQNEDKGSEATPMGATNDEVGSSTLMSWPVIAQHGKPVGGFGGADLAHQSGGNSDLQMKTETEQPQLQNKDLSIPDGKGPTDQAVDISARSGTQE